MHQKPSTFKGGQCHQLQATIAAAVGAHLKREESDSLSVEMLGVLHANPKICALDMWRALQQP